MMENQQTYSETWSDEFIVCFAYLRCKNTRFMVTAVVELAYYLKPSLLHAMSALV